MTELTHPTSPAHLDGKLARLLGAVEPLQPDLLNADAPRPKPRRWWHNAGVRFLFTVLVWLFLTMLGGFIGGVTGLVALGPMTPTATVYVTLVLIVASLLAYLALTLVFEGRRPPIELAPRRAGGLLTGLLIGGGLNALCLGIMALLGAFQVTGTNPAYEWGIPMLTAGLQAAVFEEVAFRGVMFRLVEEGLGTWGALAISASVFGAVHLTNENGTVIGAVCVALAGVLLGVLYALTRSLWLVMGLHAAWNIVQGPVFGVVVSGTSQTGSGFLVSRTLGPEWLSGGPFGMEASVVTLVVLAASSALVGWLIVKRKVLVQPAWVRRRLLAAASGTTPTALREVPASPTPTEAS